MFLKLTLWGYGLQSPLKLKKNITICIEGHWLYLLLVISRIAFINICDNLCLLGVLTVLSTYRKIWVKLFQLPCRNKATLSFIFWVIYCPGYNFRCMWYTFSVILYIYIRLRLSLFIHSSTQLLLEASLAEFSGNNQKHFSVKCSAARSYFYFAFWESSSTQVSVLELDSVILI